MAKVPASEDKKYGTYYLPTHLLERLARAARTEGRKPSEIVRRAIENYLAKSKSA